jgi:multiple sugar transport system permease protein
MYRTRKSQLTLRDWFYRIIAYVLLSFFAFVMLFPFLYMIFTSLKTSNDVFTYPPRLLPRSPEEIEVDGETATLYRLTVAGEEREMILTDESVRFGFFTNEEKVDADNSRQSESLVQVPLDEAVETGEEVVVRDSAGNDETFPIYEITVDGETQQLLLAFRGSLNKFVDPDNSEIFTYANERTTEQVDFIEFQTDNYNTVFGLKLDRALVNTTVVTLGVVAETW